MLLERTWACCLVGALLTATTTVQARQDRPLPANYTNDLYHCFLEASLNLSGQQGGNVPALSDDGVLCDLDSYQWMIEQLNPDQPPARCVDFDALANGGTDSMNDDVLEPCILWHMNYGLLASESPSTVPSTAPSSKLEATTPATAAPVVASPSAQVESKYCTWIHSGSQVRIRPGLLNSTLSHTLHPCHCIIDSCSQYHLFSIRIPLITSDTASK